jgi:hypothetical protein
MFELAGSAAKRHGNWLVPLGRAPRKKVETRMKLMIKNWLGDWFGAGRWMGLKLQLRGGLALCLLWTALGAVAGAQTIGTTTVQGTVYLANGQAGSGTLVISWPAFITASGQSVAADSTTVTIASNGSVSVNLAPNLGATPAGLYYTAVYYLSDGTTSTQYCGHRYFHKSEWRICERPAAWVRAAGDAQRKGIRRGVQWNHG